MLARHDAESRHVVGHQRVGTLGLDAHRVIVDAGNFLTLQIGPEARRATFDIRRALKREHHVVGREWRAIVELHAFAQLEFPGRVVDGLPGHGQSRAQLLLVVGHDQTVEHYPRDGVIGAQVVKMRIDGRRLGSQSDGELPRGACRGRYGYQRRGQSGDGQFQESHCFTPLVWIIVINQGSPAGAVDIWDVIRHSGQGVKSGDFALRGRAEGPGIPFPVGWAEQSKAQQSCAPSMGSDSIENATRAEPTPCPRPAGIPAGAGRAIGIVPGSAT